ncbi:membrane protein [Gordonia phage Neville]|uniref:Membrane protein n=2 Tax=Nevillevirus TaxID=3044773 RepID=A0A515MGY5_9CAUD|nr:membrane protein [Gordonia phage Neville]YP_010246040.1 membrane protein [Gordonia phage Trax]AXQ64425.1 membrane protein [Gordonia phage Neville]QDM55942.1 membrane protein [Gordonia phage Trax]
MVTRTRLRKVGAFLGWLCLVAATAAVIWLGFYAEWNWLNNTYTETIIDGREYTTGTDLDGLSVFIFVGALLPGVPALAWAADWIGRQWKKLPA